MSSDESSVSGDHHHEGYETDSNYCDSSKPSDEESVGDPDVQVDSCESDNSPHDHEPSTLPLFDGDNKTVLEALAGYFYWFSTHPSINKSALSSLLSDEHFNVFPPGNNLPSSHDEAYNFIKPHLLPTVFYSVCPNDCIIFQKTDRYDYTKLKNCPKCNRSRYAANGQPLRRFVYYPLGPRWRRLFECNETSQILQEHALRPNQGDLMTDVFDCPSWKTAYAPNGLFHLIYSKILHQQYNN